MTHTQKIYEEALAKVNTIGFLQDFLPKHVGEAFTLAELCKYANGKISLQRMRAWLCDDPPGSRNRDWEVSRLPSWKSYSIVDNETGIVVGTLKRKYYIYRIEKVKAK